MSKYTEAVDKQTAGIEHVNPGPCPGCEDCGLEDCKDMNTPEYEAAGEGGFSWHDCQICGSSLGGHRSPFHGFVSNEIVHLEGGHGPCDACAVLQRKRWHPPLTRCAFSLHRHDGRHWAQ